MEESSSLSRRRFVAVSAAAGIGIGLAGASLWPLWKYLSPVETTDEKATVAIPRSQLGVGQAHFFRFRGRPAVLLQSAPGEFIAMSAVCTHLGCVITWLPQEDIFLCPCHAGKFSKTGAVLAGPPPSPLESFPVTVKADQIMVG